jgi:hypothetical protein
LSFQSTNNIKQTRNLAQTPSIAHIDIINESTVIDDNTIAQYTIDLQTQLDRDYARFWGVTAELHFIPKGQIADNSHWWQVVFDTTDQPGALGYHTLTNQGQPVGYTFAKTDQIFKEEPSTTLSHELLEMMGDPEINKNVTVELADTHKTRQYMYENCDACETLSYKIGDTLVSDFVTPNWFIPSSPPGTQFDYLNKITKPFQLLPGGYIGYNDGDGWKQLFAQLPTDDKMALLRPDTHTINGENVNNLMRTYITHSEQAYFEYRRLPHQYSRRMRRMTPRHQWLKSIAHTNKAFSQIQSQVENTYQALGWNIHQIENSIDINKNQVIESTQFFAIPQITDKLLSDTLKQKGYEFLKRFWPNIIDESCTWWNQNKDKDPIEEFQLQGIISIIGNVLPIPYKFIPQILATIARFLIKAGLNTLCENKPLEPPIPKK